MLKLLVISLDRLKQTLEIQREPFSRCFKSEGTKMDFEENARIIPTKRLLAFFTKPEMIEVQSKPLFFNIKLKNSTSGSFFI